MIMLVNAISGLLLVLLERVSSAELDTASCLDLGFNSAKLLCSACADLRQFDLAALSDGCEKCCNRDAGSATLENTKYERAILEVCG